ncbi:unnamed protein product, partial [Nesidiocoris tenuis]
MESVFLLAGSLCEKGSGFMHGLRRSAGSLPSCRFLTRRYISSPFKTPLPFTHPRISRIHYPVMCFASYLNDHSTTFRFDILVTFQ